MKSCGGEFIKIAEPEGYQQKGKKEPEKQKQVQTLDQFFTNPKKRKRDEAFEKIEEVEKIKETKKRK